MPRDFGQWFAEQRVPAEPKPQASDIDSQLEAMGLALKEDGSVWGKCCICETRICWTDLIAIDEILRNGVGAEYCGGSPRCCP